MNCCKKILIIKISALGDVIRTNGFIKTIKEKKPEAEIYFFTNVYYSEILKLSPYIKEVIKYPRHLFANVIFDNTKNFEEKYRIIYTFLKNIQKNNFDEIYDFTNTNESVFISTFLSNYQFERINGFYINKNFNLKTHSIYWLHFNYFYEKGIFYPLTHNQFIKLFISDKIKECKGNYIIDEQIKYRVKKFLSDNNVNEKEKIYTIQIGAASSKRRWQKDELIKFLKYLNTINNNPLLFIGSDIEYNYIEEIIKSGKINGLNLSNKFNLIEIATLISLSNFLFTMDTWAMHCASEFNTPFLVLEFNYTLFPIGSVESYIYYKKEIYAEEVIKIFETFFLKNKNYTN
ncbi:MAG TPA: glycosyltransferase family 9 protein, partial [bacterium]|nr:glycosyltransferase family 9 protein [bacterium]